MCLVSFIGDHYTERWTPTQTTPPTTSFVVTIPPVTREEFDALRRDVEEMKTLLKKAKQYDIEHGEPDCEMDEKVEVLRRVAELVGVDLSDIFG